MINATAVARNPIRFFDDIGYPDLTKFQSKS